MADVGERVGQGAQDGIRIQLLGAFGVIVGDRVVDDASWRKRRAKSLVKLLALARGHRLHRDQVLDQLWPDLAPDAAANNFYQALHFARRALDPGIGRTSPYLNLRKEIVSLGPETSTWIDLDAFEQAAIEARRIRNPAAYRAALSLYTGDLLPEDRYEDWAADRREALRQSHQSLLLEMAEFEEERGESEAAVEALREVVANDPICEEAHRALMRLHDAAGRRQEVLDQYQILRAALRREVDAEPGEESRLLYEEILANKIPRHPPVDTRRASKPLTNLPAPLTSFVGRERELAEVEEMLENTRLLTLTGPGGCGKTRLATEIGRRLLGRYPDGVWLVELASLSGAALLTETVITSLGIQHGAQQTPIERLIAYLQSRHVLLVLDNCEHVIAASASLAATLLQSCPDLRILATSREALRVPGEVTSLVPSLVVLAPSHLLPDDLLQFEAIRLFVDRARAVHPHFTLTEDNAAHIARVCCRLDGMPLAVELAAARMRVLSTYQLATRLDDLFRVVSGGPRTAPRRQQALRATLDWSYDLLDDQERTLFHRLAAFAGGCTFEAAEQVCAPDGDIDILEGLANLVDKSLLRQEGEAEPRFSMLQTIREYAQEKLDAEQEAGAVRRRHAIYYLELAERAEPLLSGPEQTVWLGRLEQELPNLRVALRMFLHGSDAAQSLRLASALERFWSRRGHLIEGRDLLAAALAASAVPGPERAKALVAGGALTTSTGDFARAEELLMEGLALYRDLSDDTGVARALSALGELERWRSNWEQEVAYREEALSLFRRLGDRWGEAMALYTLAGVAMLFQQDCDRAESLFLESGEIFSALGDRWGIAASIVFRAMAIQIRGDAETALYLARTALPLCQEADIWMTSRCLVTIAASLAGLGEGRRAARLHAAAEMLYERSGKAPVAAVHTADEQVFGPVRAKLGDAVVAAAEAEGRALSVDEAIREALEDV